MIHLLAAILTLFPGFGLGYLLLRRWKAFVFSFLASLVFGSPILIGVLVEAPPIPAGMAILIFPLLVFNLYMSHMLWLQPPAEEIMEEPLVLFDYSVAPWFVTLLAGLIIILIVVTVTSQYWPETSYTPEEEEEMKLDRWAGQVEDRLGQHTLSNRVKISDGGAAFHYQYHVEPGGYTMDLYFSSLQHAEEIKRQTDNLVYYHADRVLVLHTTDVDHLRGIVIDMVGALGGGGYAIDCVQTYSDELRKATYICE